MLPAMFDDAGISLCPKCQFQGLLHQGVTREACYKKGMKSRSDPN
jgi:hypothetical protein